MQRWVRRRQSALRLRLLGQSALHLRLLGRLLDAPALVATSGLLGLLGSLGREPRSAFLFVAGLINDTLLLDEPPQLGLGISVHVPLRRQKVVHLLPSPKCTKAGVLGNRGIPACTRFGLEGCACLCRPLAGRLRP